ncbi:MAG: hypothetical protein WD022_09685 [Balneolaceae bacterium]
MEKKILFKNALAVWLTFFSLSGFMNIYAQQADSVDTNNLDIENHQELRNAIYVELIGTGYIYTFNYERVISKDLHLRIGAMYFGLRKNSGRIQTYNFPIVVNKTYGQRRGKLEIGAGLLFSNFSIQFANDEESDYSGLQYLLHHVGVTGTLGYRHNLKSNGLIRIGLQPRYLFGINDDLLNGFSVSPGISFGASF